MRLLNLELRGGDQRIERAMAKLCELAKDAGLVAQIDTAFKTMAQEPDFISMLVEQRLAFALPFDNVQRLGMMGVVLALYERMRPEAAASSEPTKYLQSIYQHLNDEVISN